MQTRAARSLGLDFGTTNTVGALSGGGAAPALIDFAGLDLAAQMFRSALCFWEDEDAAAG